ncbi:anticodon binding domain protein [Ancylostoma caninum]|uniref:Anticodon binding domain protein n=1 Tax=Ancylostoma caninum TaxID=29170 RepID=A0A368GM81_ANCCA|nr:anticodon binding domain protein [Ancylostoma caninum]
MVDLRFNTTFQAKIIRIHESVNAYAREVKNKLYSEGFEVEFDEYCPDTLNKQIRRAMQAQFNFILVVGQKEMKNSTVNVRTRDNQGRREVHLDELIAIFRRLEAEYTKECDVLPF